MSEKQNVNEPLPASACSSLLWVTNHPKSLKGLWPRRIGVVYLEGPPKATEAHTADELAHDGLVGAYVDMAENEYRKLPLARTPADMKTNALLSGTAAESRKQSET